MFASRSARLTMWGINPKSQRLGKSIPLESIFGLPTPCRSVSSRIKPMAVSDGFLVL
jgi:hypothetical protein